MLIKIKKDLFNIAQRIKNIENGYTVYFNTKNKKFQIHNKDQLRNSYCATIPYDSLDARAIDYLNQTHTRNSKKIFKAIDENNNKLIEECKIKNDEEVKYKVDEIYKYSSGCSKTLKVDFKNNLWV